MALSTDAARVSPDAEDVSYPDAKPRRLMGLLPSQSRPNPSRKTPKQFILNMRHGPIGIRYAYRNEASFRGEVRILVLIIIAMAVRECSITNWFFVMVASTQALSRELINTSREVELRHRYPSEKELKEANPGLHRKVKAAYDTAAGAVTFPLLLVGAFFAYAMIHPA